jgi:glycosyltransferase involved in cell wall biosynthesis
MRGSSPESGIAPPAASLPRVSVVIPTYNCAAYLADALDSVLAQSYPNIEIIVVDDGSTDDTEAVLRRYRDRLIQVHKTNGGLASARNAGLALASGEFVAQLDADDICHPERIAAQVAVFRQQPDVVLCSSDFSAFAADGPIADSHIAAYYALVAASPGGVRSLYSRHEPLAGSALRRDGRPLTVCSGNVYPQLVWGNFIHPPTIMVRRSVAVLAGRLDESIKRGCDYDWLIRVSRLGRAAFIDFPLLRYRYSSGQLSAARNQVHSSLGTVAVIDKLRRDDADLYRRHRQHFQRRIGLCYLSAAHAAIRHEDRRAARGYFWQSLRRGLWTLASLKMLVKLVLPLRLGKGA